MVSNCNNVPEEFVNNICTYICNWSLASDIRTQNCIICGLPIDCDQSQINGKRNFIDGSRGSYYIRCWMVPENCCIVYFHNFKGYDSHLIVRALITKIGTNVMVSANNFEKFDVISMSLTKDMK